VAPRAQRGRESGSKGRTYLRLADELVVHEARETRLARLRRLDADDRGLHACQVQPHHLRAVAPAVKRAGGGGSGAVESPRG